MTIYGFDFFLDTKGNFIQVPTVLNVMKLPQMATESELSSILDFAEVVKSTIQAALFVNTATSIFISGSL